MIRWPILLLAALIASCSGKKASKEGPAAENRIPNIPTTYVRDYPHDTTAFTEGFLFHNDQLFESTGASDDFPQTRSLFGVVDLSTGQIEIKAELNKNRYFGEGITILNGRLYQLTYQSGVGFIYQVPGFERTGEFTLPTEEGWGMTTDGKNLIMSDGTDVLTVLDPDTQKVIRRINVTERGNARDQLNELEYIDGFLYANIWMTNTVVKIDPETGQVTGKMDLSAYANEARGIYPGSLEMNGLAYHPATGTLFITGKLWPRIYELRISQ